MSDRLTKDEINTELEFYKGMFREQLNLVQHRNPVDYGEYALGHAFVWGHINLCINEMTNQWKLYRVCLSSICSKDIYGLAGRVANTMSNITISHINMD